MIAAVELAPALIRRANDRPATYLPLMRGL
jgi:hypothetical protein